MGIDAKTTDRNNGQINIDVNEIMTSKVFIKIKTLILGFLFLLNLI